MLDPRVLVILLASGFLLAGNGLLLTLTALRGDALGFEPSTIGLLGTAYYSGTLAACLLSPGIIARVGHIRTFVGLSGVATLAALGMSLANEPWAWFAARALMGFSFSGVFMVNESWLNDLADKGNRGQLLSLYRMVDLGSVTGVQFLIPWLGATGYEVMIVAALFLVLALIPVSLARIEGPPPPKSVSIDPRGLWQLSPVACVGCLTIGLTNSAFRAVGPSYAQDIGLNIEQVAFFMSLGIVGGALFQYPLGWLSDHFDRRYVLLTATAGAVVGSFILAFGGGTAIATAYVGAFLFGGFAMPLYSLSAAHAADVAAPGEYVRLAAGLALFFALGAATGPLVSALLIEGLGGQAFFFYTGSLHAAFIGFVLYRLTRRPKVVKPQGRRFEALLRNSPEMVRQSNRSRSEGQTAD